MAGDQSPTWQLPARLQTWYLQVTDQWTCRAPRGARRSPEWPRVRDEHLASHPECACCRGTKKLRVHHLTPFWVDPARELDPLNLLTLCESGKYGINCHLFIGHNGDWRKWNPLCRADAFLTRLRLQRTLEDAAVQWHQWNDRRARK